MGWGSKMTVDFCDSFWGEGNNGFDVLYHNMKYGYVATKDLAEFFRERSLNEETNSKHFAKLAKHANSCCSQGTFAPLWQVLRASSEKLSTLHAHMVQKFQDLLKEVNKYCEEQRNRHKQVKEEESSTLEVVQSIQQTTTSLMKAKEAYNARSVECEKLRRENASLKELEKGDVKCKKACDEYKMYVEKYSHIREEFERKMALSCQHFQDIELAHLRQMKEFLSSYAQVLESGHALIGQVHVEFRQQCSDMDIDKLLEQFVQARGTGTEKPGPIIFEEADLSSLGQIQSPEFGEQQNEEKSNKKEVPKHIPNQENDIQGITKFSFPSYLGTGFLKSKREKRKEKKKRKNNGNKEDTSNNIELDSQENTHVHIPQVDDEGYTIRPREGSRENDKDVFYSSSDNDSDDEEKEKKIHIEIKPLSNGAPMSASVDELRATIETLTLSPVSQHTNRRMCSSAASTPDEGPMKRSVSVSHPMNKTDSDVFSLFSPSASSASTPTGGPCGIPSPTSVGSSVTPSVDTTPTAGDRYSGLGDIFSELTLQNTSTPDTVKGPSSRGSTPTSFSGPPLLPRPPSRRAVEATSRGRMSPLPSTMTRTESIGSLTNDFKTTSMPIGSSRGPSPLTIGMCDTIPLAVAFQEVVNAYFKGTDESRCQVRLMGDMKVSFPAGIVQVLANNPSPAQLAFKVSRAGKLENVLPNKQLITLDNSQSTPDQYVYEFNMSSLTRLLRKQCEQTPNASYFNIDILKYHIKALPGAKSTPLHLVAYWKCESSTTDLRIDYKYNTSALATMAPLTNINIIVPVDGNVADMQSKPVGIWSGENSRAIWRISELSHHSENGGMGSLRARFDLNSGPSTPSTLAAQFVSQGTSLSGAEFELVGIGYRLSLVKKQIVAGKYLCESDHQTSYA